MYKSASRTPRESRQLDLEHITAEDYASFYEESPDAQATIRVTHKAADSTFPGALDALDASDSSDASLSTLDALDASLDALDASLDALDVSGASHASDATYSDELVPGKLFALQSPALAFLFEQAVRRGEGEIVTLSEEEDPVTFKALQKVISFVKNQVILLELDLSPTEMCRELLDFAKLIDFLGIEGRVLHFNESGFVPTPYYVRLHEEGIINRNEEKTIARTIAIAIRNIVESNNRRNNSLYFDSFTYEVKIDINSQFFDEDMLHSAMELPSSHPIQTLFLQSMVETYLTVACVPKINPAYGRTDTLYHVMLKNPQYLPKFLELLNGTLMELWGQGDLRHEIPTTVSFLEPFSKYWKDIGCAPSCRKVVENRDEDDTE